MATISWEFGANGFRVAITSRDGGESVISGTHAVDELSLDFTTPPNAVATSTDTDANPISRMLATPGTMVITTIPVDISASLSFRDEDSFIDASWRVGPYTISGKGKGKGLGKNTTIVPRR